MEKVYGATSAQNGLYHIGRNKWEVIYGFGKDNQESETGYNYRLQYSYLPRPEVIKRDIVETINEIVRDKILHGMTYRGHLVWLSAENQRNYSDWYELAKINSENLPVVIKLGTDDEPVELELTTLEEVEDFYQAVGNHIRQTVCEGWEMKRNLNMEEYENEKD